MNTTNQPSSNDIIIDRYILLSIKHGEATENGNSNNANSAYKELESVFKKIVQSGNRERLVPLLDHGNPAVRAKAAFHTYVLDPHRAIAVLKGVASCPGLIGFCADMVLKQIRSGELMPN